MVATGVIVADSATNRRRVNSHGVTLRAAFPSDGRSIKNWLVAPSGTAKCLSFWTYDRPRDIKSDLAAVRRVRARTRMSREREATRDEAA